ncbi:MAG: hypothetical protein AB7P97_21835 [Hyphomonadaceae bacterium]
MGGFLAISSQALQAHSEDTYPRSPELVAVQAELDALKSIGTRDQMDLETQSRLDAAIKKRNSELDERNSEWQKHDSTSVFNRPLKIDEISQS